MRGQNRTVKIKTQVGGRVLEVEYNPKTMSRAELKELADSLIESLGEDAGEED